MRDRVGEWATKMGYTGEVPKNFGHMCVPKTAHIWEQLVNKVKPKADIGKIRYNILIRRMNSPPEINDLLYPPVQELELWQQKYKLKQEIKNIEERITDNKRKINHMSTQNKMKYLQIDNIKAQMREAQNKTFLLNSKSTALQNDLVQAREQLTLCKSLTPEPAVQSKSEILSTLQKCAEKVEYFMNRQDLGACSGSVELREERKLTREIQNFEDEGLLKDVKNVLYNHDNHILWEVLLELVKKCSFDLRNCISKELGNNVVKLEENSQAKNVLHTRFIETELRTMLHEQNIKKLQAALEVQQNKVFDGLKKTNLQKNIMDDAVKLILLQKDEAGLKVVCDFMSAQIQTLTSVSYSTLELLEEQKKSLNIQQQIVDIFRSIKLKKQLYEQIYTHMISVKDEIPMCMHKLSPLIADLDWTSPLIDNVITKEIHVFAHFNLEHNRQMTTTNNSGTFLEELLTDDLVGSEDLDPNLLYMFATTIDSPFSPSESILLGLIKEKMQLNVLKALPDTSYTIDYKKYDLDEFKVRESHVEHTICKLNSLMKPSNVRRVQSTLTNVKKEVELWLEMPFKGFVDGKRLFNGHNYGYYQNLYDSYYNQLQ